MPATKAAREDRIELRATKEEKRLLATAGLRISTDVRGAVFSHLQRLSLGFHTRQRGSGPRFMPNAWTWPWLGRSMRAISFSSELLPAPEWPVRNAISPRPISSDRSESASRPFG